jgi:hypothetical protein
VHGVGPGALFVARPGQAHEIESTSTDPFGIVFWGFTLRPVARSARLEERGWWSALVDETRPSVSIRVGAIPELVDALAAEAGGPRAGVDSMITSLVTAVTVETCRAFAEPSTLVVTPPPVADRGSADVAVMLRYLNDNLSRPVEVRDVAAQVHISERQAQRIFRAATGESLMSALQRLRLGAGGGAAARDPADPGGGAPVRLHRPTSLRHSLRTALPTNGNRVPSNKGHDPPGLPASAPDGLIGSVESLGAGGSGLPRSCGT